MDAASGPGHQRPDWAGKRAITHWPENRGSDGTASRLRGQLLSWREDYILNMIKDMPMPRRQLGRWLTGNP